MTRAALLALLALAACKDSDDPGPMPSDQELRARVHEHRADLDELRAMIAAERVELVGAERVGDCRRYEGRWSCNGRRFDDDAAMLAAFGLADARWDRYRALLARVGGKTVMRTREGGAAIGIYAAGIVTSGATKALVYARVPPAPLVADTDRDRGVHMLENYAALGDGWYVEHASN